MRPRLIIPKGGPQVVYLINSWHVTCAGQRVLCRLPWRVLGIHAQREALLAEVDPEQVCQNCSRLLEAKEMIVESVLAEIAYRQAQGRRLS